MGVSPTISRLMAGAALCCALCGLPLRASEPEDELKAAVVLSFLRYSEWPATARTEGALTVGVLGRPALLQTLRRVLDGKSVESRPVKVVELKPGDNPGGCQIVYWAASKPGEIRLALVAASAAHVLTVGESERFLELGGAVNLMLVDGRISFEVDLEALDRAGIAISSKLLRFGQVRGAGKGRPPA